MKKIDWVEIQRQHDAGAFLVDLRKVFGVSITATNTAVRKGLFIKRHHSHKYTPKQREVRSKGMKRWLAKNKDNHVWKRHSKFKSIPCDAVKGKLRENGFNFVEEWTPLEDRFFSIDIAFPDTKIGIEVNGQQHYESDGRLKPYYQERHDLIEASGWKLIEIHYSAVWNQEVMESVVGFLRGKVGFNTCYQAFLDKQEEKRRMKITCPKCGGAKTPESVLCRKCADRQRGLKYRKVNRPSKEELGLLVREMAMLRIGKQYGVSDNAVRKWCRSYGIEISTRKNA